MKQSHVVLGLLRERGSRGVHTFELRGQYFIGNPSERIRELEAEGFVIDASRERPAPDRAMGARYVLVSEPVLEEARVERVVATVAPTACDGPLEPGLFDTSTFNTRRSWEDAA